MRPSPTARAGTADGGSVMIVLGIETSCDETAAAIVAGSTAGEREIVADCTLSQLAAHEPYGGVVPEIAARAHLDHLDGIVARLFEREGMEPRALDGIAATAGPGLIGGLVVGLTFAKGLALAVGRPLVAVNHLEAHALSVRLSHPEIEFPYLLLLVSGGHCQLLIVEDVGRYTPLGTTVDDAVGEAFDKAAKMMGLGYPGGPEIERRAREGDPVRFPLPRPMLGREGCDFSFAGLKTAVRHALVTLAREKGTAGVNEQDIADMCASFQAAVGDVLADRVRHAMRLFRVRHPQGRWFVMAGGVAANGHLRRHLTLTVERQGLDIAIPPAAHCTDNGAMVAWAGLERLERGFMDGLDVKARPRWPLAAA